MKVVELVGRDVVKAVSSVPGLSNESRLRPLVDASQKILDGVHQARHLFEHPLAEREPLGERASTREAVVPRKLLEGFKDQV